MEGHDAHGTRQRGPAQSAVAMLSEFSQCSAALAAAELPMTKQRLPEAHYRCFSHSSLVQMCMSMERTIDELRKGGHEPRANVRDWMCRACTAGPFTHDELDLHWMATHAQKPSSQPCAHCEAPELHLTTVTSEKPRPCPSGQHWLVGNQTCDCCAQKSSDDGYVTARSATANAALTCDGACRYDNYGRLDRDPRCSTHGSSSERT